MSFSILHWQEERFMPYPAAFLFDLVLDIQSYPEFLPHCTGASVMSRTSSSLKAVLDIGTSFFSTSFISEVTWREKKEIHISSVTGSFRALRGVWRFQTKGDGTEVGLMMDIDFGSYLKRLAFMPFLSFLTTEMIAAFQDRAAALSKKKEDL